MSSQADRTDGGAGEPGVVAPAGPAAAPVAPAAVHHLSLADLRDGVRTVLKDDGDAAARVTRCDLPGGPVVLKEWRPQGWILGLWARLLMRREIRHYQLLEGLSGIPGFLGHEENALILQFVDGEPIHRKLAPVRLRAGLDSLQATLDALHARRFVHLDLHQKRNTLVDAAGQAWVLDLGQGIDCSRGPIRRLLFPLLVRIDQRAVLQFRARYAPETFDPARRDELVARFGPRRVWWPKVLGRRLRRIVLRES